MYGSARGKFSPRLHDTAGSSRLTLFAVRYPANVCSCKHGSRLPGLSRKKQNPGNYPGFWIFTHTIYARCSIHLFSHPDFTVGTGIRETHHISILILSRHRFGCKRTMPNSSSRTVPPVGNSDLCQCAPPFIPNRRCSHLTSSVTRPRRFLSFTYGIIVSPHNNCNTFFNNHPL